MPIAQLDTIALNWREDGNPDGKAVVFANSLGTDLRLWDAVLPHLPQDLRLIRFDKRGHGLSDCPPAPYSMDVAGAGCRTTARPSWRSGCDLCRPVHWRHDCARVGGQATWTSSRRWCFPTPPPRWAARCCGWIGSTASGPMVLRASRPTFWNAGSLLLSSGETM